MKSRGWNLRKGQPDGDRGRRLGGKARTASYAQEPVDDSGRSRQQFYGQLGWWRLVEEHGREEAGRIQARRGALAFGQEMRSFRAYVRYMGELAHMREEGS
jgi:hypothetical protein